MPSSIPITHVVALYAVLLVLVFWHGVRSIHAQRTDRPEPGQPARRS